MFNSVHGFCSVYIIVLYGTRGDTFERKGLMISGSHKIVVSLVRLMMKMAFMMTIVDYFKT